MTTDGDFDYEELEKRLLAYRDYNALKVGTFSAGSNITGNVFDTDRIAVLCHKYSTIACFDYAAVGPYVQINMNGPAEGTTISEQDKELAYKDAIFISPHKFIGGPGASGVLLAKKNILLSKKPIRSGGGIVLYVNESEHEYVRNVEELEEAGTPNVLGDIKAGLVFHLKDEISVKTIHEREQHI
eukprot:CAMPEP_0202962656 /NCGR_PEP_ID=MMETSP1396-20130829/6757_1 /ASSEMBLY_ACC=CAM_ASM_000872 /TAXON_ID= /ORGANISM="Pseudokeronopsis sp., Strain Brazil" /LENGTH=184 /DNA_ID=CAMNT_0049683387 /DNA_START=713 /DNA_END=1267 /DNA_ORIENTATION=+